MAAISKKSSSKPAERKPKSKKSPLTSKPAAKDATAVAKPLKSALKKAKSEVVDKEAELKKQEEFVSIETAADQSDKEEEQDERALYELDSSDEEHDAVAEHSAAEISRNLPQPPKEPEQAAVPAEAAAEEPMSKKQKKKAAKSKALHQKEPESPTTLYISRLPHGFYEHQMMNYFRQFGPILRLKMPRSMKTGRGKSYAFIEFKYADTARIAQETMDGYLLFGRVLKCKVLPALSGSVSDNSDAAQAEVEMKLNRMWSGCIRPGEAVKPFRSPAQREISRRILAQQSKKEQDPSVVLEKLKKKVEKKDGKLKRKLASLGVEYDFDGHRQQLSGLSA